MKLATLILAGSLLTAIPSMASAQEALKGTVTTIDRINGTIAIQQTPNGTVGASGGGASEQFRVQGSLLDTLHAGDRGTFSITQTGGVKTITGFEKP